MILLKNPKKQEKDEKNPQHIGCYLSKGHSFLADIGVFQQDHSSLFTRYFSLITFLIEGGLLHESDLGT